MSAAVIELESGMSVLAMGSAREIEAALADASCYSAQGRCLLRFALSDAVFELDPGVVVGVVDATFCELEGE